MSNTQYAYTTMTDGSNLTDVYGPFHAVQLANGTADFYRRYTHNFYGTGNRSAPRHRAATARSLLLDGAVSASSVLL